MTVLAKVSSKKILRSVIQLGRDDSEVLRINMSRLQRAVSNDRIKFDDPCDVIIYHQVLAHFSHHLDCPSLQLLRDYFERDNKIEELERLKDIEATPSYARTDFAALLEEEITRRLNVRIAGIASTAYDIALKGITQENGKKKIRLQGAEAAVDYFHHEISTVTFTESTATTRGEVLSDAGSVYQEYVQAETDKDKSSGRFTGLDPIDVTCRGIKPGELHIHAAFPGELKTSFALTWSYNLVTRYRANVLYVSLEMPYKQLRRQFAVMHSANKRWESRPTLDYRKVKNGELTPDEKSFLKACTDDLYGNESYCKLDLWCPDRDVTVSSIRAYAEEIHRKREVGLIVIDHGGLVGYATNFKEMTLNLNTVVRDSKKLALQFNGGEGVPVLMLFQLNRQGKREADENGGKYRIEALSYANEAEKSADVITTTYYDREIRENGTTLFCNLKNRDNDRFKPFLASFDAPCRYIVAGPNLSQSQPNGEDFSLDDGV